MRLLITIAHYFKTETGPDWHQVVGSGRAPLAKIAALNAQIVALHRYFGPRRLARDARAGSIAGGEANTLDIVIMTVRGANVLDQIGIDPTEYMVEYFDGPPLMLAFEAQRIMRERAGAYDFYGYMEDDLSVTDPAFFDKIGWFAAEFGVDKMLVPARYEISHTGTLAKMTIEPRLSGDTVKALRRAGLPATLSGNWHGQRSVQEQTFHLPNNPHGGCYFLTDAQLKHWMAQPSFYDRDASWVDPLVSAATYAPGRVFGMYRAGEPDPWFLEIEHFGTFYASMAAQGGQRFGEPPLLALAENAGAGGGAPGSTVNMITAEAHALRHELESLKRSRTRLLKAFIETFWRKLKG